MFAVFRRRGAPLGQIACQAQISGRSRARTVVRWPSPKSAPPSDTCANSRPRTRRLTPPSWRATRSTAGESSRLQRRPGARTGGRPPRAYRHCRNRGDRRARRNRGHRRRTIRSARLLRSATAGAERSGAPARAGRKARDPAPPGVFHGGADDPARSGPKVSRPAGSLSGGAPMAAHPICPRRKTPAHSSAKDWLPGSLRRRFRLVSSPRTGARGTGGTVRGKRAVRYAARNSWLEGRPGRPEKAAFLAGELLDHEFQPPAGFVGHAGDAAHQVARVVPGLKVRRELRSWSV